MNDISIPFRSRSAALIRDAKNAEDAIARAEEARVHIQKSKKIAAILWLGKKDAYWNFGEEIGFKIIDAEVAFGDMSLILSAKALVICETAFRLNQMRLINFASNYGVPSVWVHSHIVPHQWMWSFNLCVVGKPDLGKVWRQICQLIR